MNKLRNISFSIVVMAATALMVTGCGDKPAPQEKPAAVTTAPAVAPKPQVSENTNPSTPSYDATLAEGIDFRRPGYPNFVADVSGISTPESWGRWTDANLSPTAKIRFKEPLPTQFLLTLDAIAFASNIGGNVIVRAGDTEQSFVAKPESATYNLTFNLKTPSDTIEIIPPKPASPSELNQSGDSRKLGIGLITLKIENIVKN